MHLKLNLEINFADQVFNKTLGCCIHNKQILCITLFDNNTLTVSSFNTLYKLPAASGLCTTYS